MTIENVTSVSDNRYNKSVSRKDSSTQIFVIPPINEQPSETTDIGKNNSVDPLNAAEAMTGKIPVTEPSYTVTDEEAEYFREKYGYTYSEEKAAELYYELADKGIVSRTYFGGGDPSGLGINLTRDIGFVADKVYVKDVSRTDINSPYKKLWDSFMETYDRKINTWEDALQENIDFDRYVRENKSDADYLFRQHYDKVIDGLEKTMNVISRIFG